jgi:methylglyoxal synthase
MLNQTAVIGQRKKIAFIAHDNKKADLLEWVKFNRETLLQHELYATGTTGRVIEKELGAKSPFSRAARWVATNRSARA